MENFEGVNRQEKLDRDAEDTVIQAKLGFEIERLEKDLAEGKGNSQYTDKDGGMTKPTLQ